MDRFLQRIKTPYRNIYIFYLMAAIINGGFVASNWIYFWHKFADFGTIGLLDAIGFAFALFLEIPSGALADMIGKRKTLIFAFLMGVIGIFTMATTNGIHNLFIGWMLVQFAYAFYSGTGEALAYDTLIDLKSEDAYEDVILTQTRFVLSFYGIIVIIGGFAYDYWFRLPHFLWLATLVVGFVASLFVIEPKTNTVHFNAKNYVGQLSQGFKHLLQRNMRPFILFFFTLNAVTTIYNWGLLRPAIATSFGFFAPEQGIILTILSIIGILVIKSASKVRRFFGDFYGLIFLSLSLAAAFLVASQPIGHWGFLVMLTIFLVSNISSPWLSIIVNKHVSSQYRATTISTMSLINQVPYILVGAFIGKFIDAGKLANVSVGISIFILIIVIINFFAYGRKQIFRSTV